MALRQRDHVTRCGIMIMVDGGHRGPSGARRHSVWWRAAVHPGRRPVPSITIVSAARLRALAGQTPITPRWLRSTSLRGWKPEWSELRLTAPNGATDLGRSTSILDRPVVARPRWPPLVMADVAPPRDPRAPAGTPDALASELDTAERVRAWRHQASGASRSSSHPIADALIRLRATPIRGGSWNEVCVARRANRAHR